MGSWLIVEPGAKVLDAEGRDAGRVVQVVGEEDVFDGLVIKERDPDDGLPDLLLGRKVWVPAELVDRIDDDGTVHLTFPREEIHSIDQSLAPAAARLR
jgi:hypothetical protein